ncbi:YciY family protein [Buttiauxella warmboldiae]|nr:YciY family protein [Buttiauxella warmboldiae]RPH22510.1 YciY family protein [Buttiauxella warmboldiae]
MRRSRNEVGRWRMLRQTQRRRSRWLEGQSRRNMRIHAIRKCQTNRQRNSLLFAIHDQWAS